MLKKKTGPIPPPPLSKEGLMVWRGGGRFNFMGSESSPQASI